MKIKSKIEKLKEEYRELLLKHICYIGFQKTSGKSRFMLATLVPIFIKKKINPSFKQTEAKPNVLIVWDIEKDDWRSIKVNSIAIFKKFK
jgi:hypothetical protein